MNYGLYQSAGGVLSNLHKFQVVSNNLANAQTNAFKADLALSQQRLPERLESGVNTDPQWLLEQLGGGQLATPTIIEFTQGDIVESGSPMDVAIDGDGFFVVGPERPGGTDDLALTRDGRFMMNPEGHLVMASTGWHVLDDRGKMIQLEPGDVRITDDGGVWQQGEQVAVLGLKDVEHPDALRKTGDGLLRTTEHSGPLRDSASNTIQQGYLEESTVNPIIAMKDLLEISRALEANVRMMQYQDTLMGQAAGTLGKVT